MADEKAKIVTDATGPSSGPAPAQPEVDAQVSKQEQSAPEAPTPDKAEAPAQEAPVPQKKRMSEIQSRMKELDNLFQRIYEDNISGKLSD